MIEIKNFKNCTRCHKGYFIEDFMRIVKRKTYGIDCDNEGFVYYERPSKTCKKCRTEFRNKKILFKDDLE